MRAGSEDASVESREETTRRISKRDFLLLSLVSVGTALLLIIGCEILARLFWPTQRTNACVTENDHGFTYKPNCTASVKLLETPVITYRYNDCGYRSDASCGPKPAGTIRLVVIGSSVAEGYNVQYQNTFAVRAASELQRVTGSHVEVQNLGKREQYAMDCYRRLGEALALKPDLIVYAFFPSDLERRIAPFDLAHRNDPQFASKQLTPVPKQRLNIFQLAMISSRAASVVKHFWYENTDNFLRSVLPPDDKAGYLYQPLSPEWNVRIADFRVIVADMAARCRAAGVALLLMPVPTRQQAALLGRNEHLAHIDACSFSDAMRAMAQKLNIGYVDAYKDFRGSPSADRDYYPEDLHPNVDGEELLSRALIRKCLDGSVPAFSNFTHLN